MPKLEYRHVFQLVDGETIICLRQEAKRTMDRRGAYESPKVVWEVISNGVTRRLWPEEIVSWSLEER